MTIAERVRTRSNANRILHVNVPFLIFVSPTTTSAWKAGLSSFEKHDSQQMPALVVVYLNIRTSNNDDMLSRNESSNFNVLASVSWLLFLILVLSFFLSFFLAA